MRLTRSTLAMTVAAAALLVPAAVVGDPVAPVDRPPGGVSLESGTATPAVQRAVRVPAVSVDRARVRKPKGTPELPPSALGDLDIPATALLAYQSAAAVLAQVDGSCRLSWTLLAAIGRVESDHGRYAGAVLTEDGVSVPAIRGVALDGRGPVARIPDTDDGQLDGDPVWDRAVGPMQFLPSTWSSIAVDADGDGVRSPDDIDDAALAAAVFLCSGSGDLGTDAGMRAAVFRYNPSDDYVDSVLAVERGYRSGDFQTDGEVGRIEAVRVLVVTSSGVRSVGSTGGSGNPGTDADHSIEAGGPLGHHGPTGSPTDQSGPVASDPGPVVTPDPGTSGTPGNPDTGSPDTGSPGGGGSGAGSPDQGAPDPGTTGPGTPDPGAPDPGTPDPGTPNPPGPSESPGTPGTPSAPGPTEPPSTPDPTPDPSPSRPPTSDLVTLTGTLDTCGPDQKDWCVDDLPLDVGDATFLTFPAAADFDAGGSVETNGEELAGLAGTEVTLLVVPDTAPAAVVTINGMGYKPVR